MRLQKKKHDEAKQRHPNMVCLFRAGDFYETYGGDAHLLSRVIGTALVLVDDFPMTSFPVCYLETNLRRLLDNGHRVAICE